MKNFNVTEAELQEYAEKWSSLNYWLREMAYKSISAEEGIKRAKKDLEGKTIKQKIEILKNHIAKAIV